LNLQQAEHRRVILLEHLGVQGKPAFFEHFLQVRQHSLANARDGEDFLGFADQVCDLLGKGFDGLGGIAVGADAEGILAVDFEQVGGFVENAGDGFVVHAESKITTFWQKLTGETPVPPLTAAPKRVQKYCVETWSGVYYRSVGKSKIDIPTCGHRRSRFDTFGNASIAGKQRTIPYSL
jgi:hypothetical protein